MADDPNDKDVLLLRAQALLLSILLRQSPDHSVGIGDDLQITMEKLITDITEALK